MPQLLPFFFVNQIIFALFALFFVVFLFSCYVLPYFLHLFTSRMYIRKL